MGWVFFLIASVFFFLGGVGSVLIPNPMMWGLFFLALGLTVGGSLPWTWWGRPPNQ
jgi:hypothetical protein